MKIIEPGLLSGFVFFQPPHYIHWFIHLKHVCQAPRKLLAGELLPHLVLSSRDILSSELCGGGDGVRVCVYGVHMLLYRRSRSCDFPLLPHLVLCRRTS